ncbi:hypothetical protein L9W92_13160 [Pelotomaculum terephthalicicum JT]|uniref:type III-B CRISPR module-associated Cmr3 family protein n=1 Tax=Pelotomaculum terephthalicicum TaxID=206393 RepID=UPI001F03C47C|nr:type III-B CRISPR module-associated Cmr3 family protein [Pelotomaculum terephthalicicum]MCG9968984.1 hypothetical protein [Pelotomaculum terephthalicicum JT]
MIIRMEALDTLFFRDGKPFSRGDESWASDMFPPNPPVFYGALRSAYFARNPGELSKANQPGDPTGGLQIKGLYLQVEDQVCLPLPLDCVGPKGDRDKKAFPLKLAKAPVVSSHPAPLLLESPVTGDVKVVEGGLLDYSSMNEYLNLVRSEFF